MFHRRELGGVRRDAPGLNGLVRIGTGRDAADAAVASLFGNARCTHMEVTCQLGEGQRFVPIGRKQLNKSGVALAPAD